MMYVEAHETLSSFDLPLHSTERFYNMRRMPIATEFVLFLRKIKLPKNRGVYDKVE